MLYRKQSMSRRFVQYRNRREREYRMHVLSCCPSELIFTCLNTAVPSRRVPLSPPIRTYTTSKQMSVSCVFLAFLSRRYSLFYVSLLALLLPTFSCLCFGLHSYCLSNKSTFVPGIKQNIVFFSFSPPVRCSRRARFVYK